LPASKTVKRTTVEGIEIAASIEAARLSVLSVKASTPQSRRHTTQVQDHTLHSTAQRAIASDEPES